MNVFRYRLIKQAEMKDQESNFSLMYLIDSDMNQVNELQKNQQLRNGIKKWIKNILECKSVLKVIARFV